MCACVSGLYVRGHAQAALIRIGLIEMIRFCKKFYTGVQARPLAARVNPRTVVRVRCAACAFGLFVW